MKRYYFVATVFIFGLCLCVVLFFNGMTPKTLRQEVKKEVQEGQNIQNSLSTSTTELGSTSLKMLQPTTTGPTLSFGSTAITVDVADTPKKQTQGLSGRSSLAENSGMLFVFDRAGLWGIWMKDMNFPIDILWFDETFSVITIKENATPESYPNVFKPIASAKYVLEVPAGFVSSHNVTVGERATFSAE